jgi:hypothetical protein
MENKNHIKYHLEISDVYGKRGKLWIDLQVYLTIAY